jgi:hypothetical protein
MSNHNSNVKFITSDIDKLVKNKDTSLLKANLLNESISNAINNEYKSSRSNSLAHIATKKVVKKEKQQLKYASDGDDDSKSSIGINMPIVEEDIISHRREILNYSRFRDSFMNLNNASSPRDKNTNIQEQLDLSISCITGSIAMERNPIKKPNGKFKKYTNIFKGIFIFI